MRKLDEDLKRGIYRRAYILTGEETYIKRQYRDRLLAALCDPEDEMNVSRFEGKDISPEQIIDLAETLPFFADRRVILLENTGWLKPVKKKADEQKKGEKEKKNTASGPAAQMADYLPEMPDSTVLIFVEEEADKRGRLYKIIRDFGGNAEFAVQTPDVLQRWISRKLKQEGKWFARDARDLFSEFTGTSMEVISRELEKLICYTYGRNEISTEDVRAVCSGQTEERIFRMIDAIEAHQKQRALSLYADLLALRVSPMKILSFMQKQFQILMETADLTEKGYGRSAIAQKTGSKNFAVSKNQTLARRLGMNRIVRLLGLCSRTDEEIKTGRIDAQIGVELLIVSCMQE